MAPFKTKLTVRMYDTDMAGILYFGNQFRFAHDAFEQMMDLEGYNFQRLIDREPYIFVIVHAESDYLTSLKVGDELDVTCGVAHIGTTSFSLEYTLTKVKDGSTGEVLSEPVPAGRSKTVHVCLDKMSREKSPLDERARALLSKYLASE